MPQEPQIPIPQPKRPIFKKIVFDHADVDVQRGPNDSRILVITLPIGEQYLLQLQPEPARAIGMHLAAPGIAVPDSNGTGSPHPGMRG